MASFTINGPNGGNSTIFGNTSGDDIINAFDFNNNIIAGGANDQIFTGAGSATVDLGSFVGVTSTVNVGGAFNTVFTSGAGPPRQHADRPGRQRQQHRRAAERPRQQQRGVAGLQQQHHGQRRRHQRPC